MKRKLLNKLGAGHETKVNIRKFIGEWSMILFRFSFYSCIIYITAMIIHLFIPPSTVQRHVCTTFSFIKGAITDIFNVIVNSFHKFCVWKKGPLSRWMCEVTIKHKDQTVLIQITFSHFVLTSPSFIAICA